MKLARFLRFLGLSLALFCSSCFRADLPEYFAGYNGVVKPASQFSSAAAPRVVVIVLPEDFFFKERRKDDASLGSQYVLGFVPVTRTTLSYDGLSYLTEVSLDYFAAQGMTTLVLPERLLPEALRFNPVLIIKPEIQDLSVNTYDFLFFRKLAVEGNLTLKLLNAAGGVSRVMTNRFYESRFRARGSAPQLAYLFEQASRETLSKKLPGTYLAKLHARPLDAYAGGGNLVFINRTTLGTGHAESLSDLFQSYGYADLPSPKSEVLSRIVQRGLQEGFLDKGNTAFSLSRDISNELINARSANRILFVDSSLRELRTSLAEGTIGVSMRFTILNYDEGRKRTILECAGAVKDLKAEEGENLVMAVERASRLLASKIGKQEEQEEKVKLNCR